MTGRELTRSVIIYSNYNAVDGISIEMANCPPNAFAIRSSVATEGFAIPLSILDMSD